jgi:hypothetical protein
MGFMDRLLGRQKAPAAQERETPLSLQLLFPGTLRLNVNTVEGALRGFDSSLAQARFELDPQASTVMGAEVGVARWGRHVVQAVVFSQQMPSAVVELCVTPAHYGAELKARARAHASHALLFYAGEEKDSLEQYVALALVAVALAKEGALVVMNESAHTSFPAQPLIPEEGEDLVDLLRTMPLTALYVGFAKLAVQGDEGVWMRTYGAPKMGLPDLAWHARSDAEAHQTFELFSGLLEYLRASGTRFGDGHTAEWQDRHVRLRVPSRSEQKFLDSPGQLFVLEPREHSSLAR